MTVGELLDALSDFDLNKEVFVSGGWDDAPIKSIEEKDRAVLITIES